MDTILPSESTADTAPAASEATKTCGARSMMYLIAEVIAECTEPEGHKGMHYDTAFSRSWHGS